jgi:hypothetical protein
LVLSDGDRPEGLFVQGLRPVLRASDGGQPMNLVVKVKQSASYLRTGLLDIFKGLRWLLEGRSGGWEGREGPLPHNKRWLILIVRLLLLLGRKDSRWGRRGDPHALSDGARASLSLNWTHKLLKLVLRKPFLDDLDLTLLQAIASEFSRRAGTLAKDGPWGSETVVLFVILLLVLVGIVGVAWVARDVFKLPPDALGIDVPVFAPYDTVDTPGFLLEGSVLSLIAEGEGAVLIDPGVVPRRPDLPVLVRGGRGDAAGLVLRVRQQGVPVCSGCGLTISWHRTHWLHDSLLFIKHGLCLGLWRYTWLNTSF